MTTPPLYKTTIIIWSEFEPTLAHELSSLAQAATDGDAYCSIMRAERVEDPASDTDWDGTEFFNDDAPAAGGGATETKVIRRRFQGGTEDVTWAEFVRSAIQDDQAAVEVAERMLAAADGETYAYNADEPEFYEEFTIIDRAALAAAVDNEREES